MSTEAPLILNVDDYDANRYLRSGLLRKAGYQVREARGGKEALAMIAAEPPDLVILDVQMPDMDGLEVCRRVRLDPNMQAVLILHVSATATGSESMVSGLDNGADGYLTDTTDPNVLLATVRALLRLRRAEQERNDARARLHESERRLARLVDNITDVVYRLRLFPDVAVEYISPSLTPLTGYRPDEYYADPDLVWRLVHPEDAPRLQALLQPDVEEKSSVTLRWLCRDGRTIWTEHRVTAVRGENGRVAALEGVARDVTLQMQVEEELRRANQLKDEFLATLSHELRTPLNAIVGWSQMLKTTRLTPDVTQRAIDSIARNAMAQRQLINDVLDVSRIVTGKMRLEQGPVDLAAAVSAAVDSVRPAIEAKGLELRLALGDGPVPILGDADRLQQVFWNLLSNAVKFTPAGGHLAVTLSATPSSVEVSVEDTGVGIPSWFLPHVFERFSQVDSSMHRRHHGLGLGLALVRHLVELHGGTVRADSEGEDRGATLTVRLPVQADGHPAVVDVLTGEHDAPRRARAQALVGVRVLLVDDENDSRQIVAAILRQAGAVVAEAGSSSGALTMLRVAVPDVLISDIGMPDQDGYDLIREVRRLPAEQGGSVPGIALTAYGRDEDRDRAIDAGYQVHIPKPVLPDDLIRETAALLGVRS